MRQLALEVRPRDESRLESTVHYEHRQVSQWPQRTEPRQSARLHGMRKVEARSLNGRLTPYREPKTFTRIVNVARYVMPDRAVSIDSWRNDVRHGLRVLANSRGFTLV